MKLLTAIALLLCMGLGCTNKAEKNKSNLNASVITGSSAAKFSYNNIVIEIKKIKACSYPDKNPLFEKRKNKKLLVLQIAVSNTGNASNQDIVPLAATITDEKGNSYETSPGVVAMAQSSGCIKGDDLSDYNNIWSGNVATGETKTAFVIGFEIPENIKAEKLYWNKSWASANKYILLNKTDHTVNH